MFIKKTIFYVIQFARVSSRSFEDASASLVDANLVLESGSGVGNS